MNNNGAGQVYLPNITKLIALVAVGAFASGTMFAGQHGDCAKQATNHEKASCSISMASFNLSPEQKSKMKAAMSEHSKAGCSAAAEAKLETEAKSILTKEQFAKFESEKKGEKEKTRT